MEKEFNWIFTFCADSPNGGRCVRLRGTYGNARLKMFELFGDKWAFQYREDAWKRNQKLYNYMLETEISIEEALKNVNGK